MNNKTVIHSGGIQSGRTYKMMTGLLARMIAGENIVVFIPDIDRIKTAFKQVTGRDLSAHLVAQNTYSLTLATQ